MTLTQRLRSRGPDKGSGALALILTAMLFLVIAGFLIDTGLAIHQRERAADEAEQAARYAANHISAQDLRDGQGVVIDGGAACDANVKAFVRQSGFSGADVDASGCTAASGDTVTVRVRLTYKPILMSLIPGGGEPKVTGYATAQAVQEQ